MHVNIPYHTVTSWGEREYESAPLSVEDGKLKLVIDDKEYLFDLEEMADLITLLQQGEEIRKKHRE